MSYGFQPFGIRVILVEPAFVMYTNFHNNVIFPLKTTYISYSSPYREFTQRLFENHANVHEYNQTKEEEETAKTILYAAMSENPNQR